MTTRLKASSADRETIRAIGRRYHEILIRANIPDHQQFADACIIALTTCHIRYEFDLDKLLGFDNLNLLHDIRGIVEHGDPDTGELHRHFWPRCDSRKPL